MEEKFINVDGNKIRYLDSESTQDPLVLIHGLGASAERWEHVIPLLEKHYRLIVPDLIGFGYSDKPLVDYTIGFFSNFLKEFLEESGIKKTYIIGSSLGGQITAEFTSANNNFVEKLILVSPSGMMKQSTPTLDAYVMAALYPNELAVENAFKLMGASVEEISPEFIADFVHRMRMPNAKMAFMSTLLGLKNSTMISEKLKTISVPTMIIWGSKDPVIPIQHADDFVSGIKDCHFYRMDGSGHTPYVDNPMHFADVVLEFLKK